MCTNGDFTSLLYETRSVCAYHLRLRLQEQTSTVNVSLSSGFCSVIICIVSTRAPYTTSKSTINGMPHTSVLMHRQRRLRTQHFQNFCFCTTHSSVCTNYGALPETRAPEMVGEFTLSRMSLKPKISARVDAQDITEQHIARMLLCFCL